jgi:DNA-binding beta-propeller fold protein YncE
MTRRGWGVVMEMGLLTGCDSCDKEKYKWVQVPYGGKMYRIYTRKVKGKVEIEVYEEYRNIPLGTTPWRPVKYKEETLDLLPRNMVVDSGTGATLPNVQLGTGREAAVTLRPRVYILDVYGDDRVVAMDGDTLERVGVVSMQQTGLVGLEISPDRRQLYVAIRAQKAFETIPARPAAIQILTANPLALSRRIDLPGSVIPMLTNQSLVVSTDGRTLYLVNEGPFNPPVGHTASTLVRIDLASGQITGELGGLGPGRAFGPLVRSADGRMLYSLTNNSVAFIDLASFSLMTEILVRGTDLVMHPDGSRLYISTSRPPRVQVVDTVAARLLTPITLAASGQVTELEITGNGRYLFAHHDISGSLHVVDLRRGLKVGELPETPDVGRIGVGR